MQCHALHVLCVHVVNY